MLRTHLFTKQTAYCTHAHPAWWLMEPASAFPEPQGRMPTGVFIACSQSERSINPLITYKTIPESEMNVKKENIYATIFSLTFTVNYGILHAAGHLQKQ